MGNVIQVLQTTYTANTDLTAAIPLDDTVPLSTEGTQVLSQAITLASAANKVLVIADLWGASTTNVNVNQLISALFRGATCIDAKAVQANTPTAANFYNDSTYSYFDSPGSTAAQTYSIRVGPASTAESIRLNGASSGRHFGGVSACTLTVIEVTP